MNASYKIVLLGAFVVFAAVVGYYVFSGDGSDTSPPPSDEIAALPAPGDDAATPQPEPQPRPVIENVDREPQPEPEPEPEPRPTIEDTPEVANIGETTDDLPDAPVIDSSSDFDRIAALDNPRRGPSFGETPTTDTFDDTTTDTPDTSDLTPRPAPTPETADRNEDTVEGEPAGDPVTDDAPDSQPEPDAEPAPRPVPPAPGTIPRTYTVEAGDTFASIAVAFYGEERAWFDIAQANPSVDPKRLQVGQSIVLPNRDPDVREREEVRPPAPGNDESYTVRPGDNLSKIAVRFYGDAEQWELIYARNRQLIGPRPDALKVGMELVIPQAYDGAE
jgi:LysM repeat protein